MITLRKLLSILLLGNLGAALAADGDVELLKLRSSYQNAVDRAVKPLRSTYEKELLKLLEKRTKAGDLNAALEVKKELEVITGKSVVTNPEEATETASVPETKGMESLFVKKTWKTATGTKFSFEKDGEGFRQFGADRTPIKWRARGSLYIEVTGQATQGGAERTWFMHFKSRDTAFYGETREDISAPLTPVED